jgi:hypothetical protein
MNHNYSTEVATRIPDEILSALEPHASAISVMFPKDAIPIFDEDKNWDVIIDGMFGGLKVDCKWVRIYAIQRAFAASTECQNELSKVHTIPEEGPVGKHPRLTGPSPIIARIARKSSNPVAISASSPPDSESVQMEIKKPFIQTVPLTTEEFPPLASNAPREFRQITVTVSKSGISKKVIVRKCDCAYESGLTQNCVCVSKEGLFLVPGKLIKSRQVRIDFSGQSRLINESEYLAQWRPYSNGNQYPESWISVDVLKQWRSGVLVDYLISRIQFAAHD